MKMLLYKMRNLNVLFRSGMRLGTMAAMFCLPVMLFGQFQPEDISRGMVAVQKSASSVYVGWRLLATDPDSVGFNLYRITDDAAAIKLNDDPLTGGTNFLDTTDIEGSTHQYYVAAVDEGVEQTPSDTVDVWGQNYLEVPLNKPPDGSTQSGDYTYSPNDASTADLDGDGEYEIILKWDPSNSQDNSNGGHTGNTIIDGYEMDGTHMWRIDLGINVRSGAHYVPFMVYDMDGDGIAEVMCRTAPGSKDGSDSFLSDGPAASDDDNADYRNSGGYILTGPEYLTVFNGADGTEISTTDYRPARGAPIDWGDDYGNRVDRFTSAVLYLDGTNPSLVTCRGIYEKMMITAWDYDGGNLTHRWTFDTEDDYEDFRGMGSHNLSVGDLDGDGNDEILYGNCAIDDDGTGMWSLQPEIGWATGDAMHLADIIPDRPGLEKFGGTEGGSSPAAHVLDAATGEVLWDTEPGDAGRNTAGDLVPSHYGMEVWGGTPGLMSSKGADIGSFPSSTNHVVWWDGDLSRELLNGIAISKYQEGVLLQADDCASNNGSKSNPSLQADLFGDWREEVMWRTSDNENLRIFTTTDTTQYRITTLMHDPMYRLGIAWQNNSYNQPPHTSYFLGTDMFTPDSLIAPGIPSNFTLSASSDFIQLNWLANLEGDLAGYNVYRSEEEEGTYDIINDSIVTSTSFRDSSVTLDVLYYYKITAVDTFDNASEFTEIVSGAATLKPDWPTGVNGNYGSTGAYIFWDQHPSANVVGFNVYRSQSSGVNYEQVNDELITDSSYADLGLTNGTTYYYVVTAVDDEDRESFYSDEINVTPGTPVILQSEDQKLMNIFVQAEHIGFNGTGFTNFDATGYVQFEGVYSPTSGWRYLVFRHALGSGDRSGNLVVNDTTYSLTMVGTGDWTNYIEDSIKIKMNAQFDNMLRFEATGGDFGNLDQIRVGDATTAPEPGPGNGTGINNAPINLISDFSIAPNPFNNQTMISVTLKESASISIDIFNSVGQKVTTLTNNKTISGRYEIMWDGTSDAGVKLGNGIYFCRIALNNETVDVKNILLKQ